MSANCRSLLLPINNI